jgi:DNA repair exonuclease SbcCD ATPase subunit
MKNYIIIFLYSMSFLLNSMDFDTEILWLQLIEHPRHPSDSRKTYYFQQKQQSPLTVLKSKEIITKIAGSGSSTLEQRIELNNTSSKTVNSTNIGYKLRTARNDNTIKMITFLNEQGYILGVISQAQLKMFLDPHRWSIYGHIPVDARAVDNLINFHALQACPEIFENASNKVNGTLEKYKTQSNTIISQMAEKGKAASRIEAYQQLVQEETEAIQKTLEPFLQQIKDIENQKKCAEEQQKRIQQKEAREDYNKKRNLFGKIIGGSFLGIIAFILFYYRLH